MHAMTKSQPPSTPNKHAALVAQACRRIEAAEQPPSLDDLALQAGLSPFHFHRVFKAATGLTPKAYADAHRANAVRASLACGGTSVTEAIFDAGFNANSRFYEHADAMLGMKPTQYRAGGVDARIEFAIGESSLGAILVARSQRGVCAISLGDDAEALLRELQDRFPRAELVGGDAAFEQLVLARIVEPTSKADSLRVLDELGVGHGSLRTMFRSLARAQERGYRDTVASACFEHASTSGDVSLCLYDVTTLYFEAEHEDELRKVGY